MQPRTKTINWIYCVSSILSNTYTMDAKGNLHSDIIYEHDRNLPFMRMCNLKPRQNDFCLAAFDFNHIESWNDK